jgi:thioredoxin reductase
MNPPGSYPVVVVGSGPGALQVSWSLRHRGIAHAVISADPAPGGMFRRWPFFQRLLSWTKPYAMSQPGSPLYERFDWNSLLSNDPAATCLQPGFMDGSSSFPTRAEMEANLVAFTERSALEIQYGCAWRATRLVDEPDGTRFVLDTDLGEYRCAVLVVAVGVAEPWTPAMPGAELVRHYGQVQPAESYAGKRVFIIGKQNSGFELASGLLPWASQLVLASPSPTSLSVTTRTLVGVRARYLQPYEDAVLGGGVTILDAAIDHVEPSGDGALTVHVRRTDRDGAMAFTVDEVIAATGFTAPLQDLPALGCAVTGRSRLPVQTPWWESVTLPGLFFAGTITQGARGLRRHGVPSNSGAVHGARYNAQVLAGHIAETRFGATRERPILAPAAAVDRIAGELTDSPALFHQRGYLARVLTADGSGGLRDDGIVPLAHAIDGGGPDSVAVTLEGDGSGSIYPVLYARSGGAMTEHMMEADMLLRYDGVEARRAITEVVSSVVR